MNKIKFLKRFLVTFLVLASLYGGGRIYVLFVDRIYHGMRAPYLQLAGPQSMMVRWQTDEEVQGRIRVGLDPSKLDRTMDEPTAQEEHRFTLDQLQPGQKYFYSVECCHKKLYRGETYWFVMPGMAEQGVKTRLWVLGDPGKGGKDQQAVRNAATDWMRENQRPEKPLADLIVTLGDNAYRSGANEQFQNNFFAPYQDLFKNIPILPGYGNHDSRRAVFFKLFDFPENGELGGPPSKTESWYSINYNDLHLISLNTMSRELRHGSTMIQWLEKDLAANDRQWIIATLHHPPYTDGSHSSDDKSDSNGRLIKTREILVPILEKGGVDLVLAGHSHGYERTSLINGHYGPSSTYSADKHLKGKVETGGVLFKPALISAPNSGTVYVVAGSSSKVDGGAYNHPAMSVSHKAMGSLVIDVSREQLGVTFISDQSQILDAFTIEKTVRVADQ